jgi:hypothetical protein
MRTLGRSLRHATGREYGTETITYDNRGLLLVALLSSLVKCKLLAYTESLYHHRSAFRHSQEYSRHFFVQDRTLFVRPCLAKRGLTTTSFNTTTLRRDSRQHMLRRLTAALFVYW